MIDRTSYETMRKYATGGTVVCLGTQVPVPGSGFGTLEELFGSLGYSTTLTMDVTGPRSFHHNLNTPWLPLRCKSADLVFDGGTSEHIANIGECLTTIVRLCKVGGIVCQTVPLNCYGSSYYGIDPLLLHDFYAANGFEELELFIFSNDSWKSKLMQVATRCLPAPWLEAMRSRVARNKPVRNWLLAEGAATRYEAMPRYATDARYAGLFFFRRVPLTACTLYLGRKTTALAEIRWPTQRQYR